MVGLGSPHAHGAAVATTTSAAQLLQRLKYMWRGGEVGGTGPEHERQTLGHHHVNADDLSQRIVGHRRRRGSFSRKRCFFSFL